MKLIFYTQLSPLQNPHHILDRKHQYPIVKQFLVEMKNITIKSSNAGKRKYIKQLKQSKKQFAGSANMNSLIHLNDALCQGSLLVKFKQHKVPTLATIYYLSRQNLITADHRNIQLQIEEQKRDTLIQLNEETRVIVPRHQIIRHSSNCLQMKSITEASQQKTSVVHEVVRCYHFYIADILVERKTNTSLKQSMLSQSRKITCSHNISHIKSVFIGASNTQSFPSVRVWHGPERRLDKHRDPKQLTGQWSKSSQGWKASINYLCNRDNRQDNILSIRPIQTIMIGFDLSQQRVALTAVRQFRPSSITQQHQTLRQQHYFGCIDKCIHHT